MAHHTLRMRIVNMASLPDGGPLEVTAAPGELLEVGRDSGIGWSLPDPHRFISGRHLEIRFEGDEWYLYDISTNGTFLNGASARVKSPHPLQSGDRLVVGHYSIEATLETTGAAASGPAADIWGGPQPRPSAQRPPVPPADIWGTGASDQAVWEASPETPAAQPLPQSAPPPAPPQPEPPARDPQPPLPQSPTPERAGPAPPSSDAVLEAIAAAAGLSEGSLSRDNPLETATEIGRTLHAMSEELSSLLQARAVARRQVRSGQMTMIGREDNNPLKFMPSADQALGAMFGPPRPGFQRGSEAVRAAFADIKRHQYATHAAIQPALARLLEDLAPETIEARVKSPGLLSNRRAKAWDTFVERWDAKARAHDNGMLDVFMAYFAEAYDGETGG